MSIAQLFCHTAQLCMPFFKDVRIGLKVSPGRQLQTQQARSQLGIFHRATLIWWNERSKHRNSESIHRARHRASSTEHYLNYLRKLLRWKFKILHVTGR